MKQTIKMDGKKIEIEYMEVKLKPFNKKEFEKAEREGKVVHLR